MLGRTVLVTSEWFGLRVGGWVWVGREREGERGERERDGGRPDGALGKPVLLVFVVASVIRVEDQRASDTFSKKRQRAAVPEEW